MRRHPDVAQLAIIALAVAGLLYLLWSAGLIG